MHILFFYLSRAHFEDDRRDVHQTVKINWYISFAIQPKLSTGYYQSAYILCPQEWHKKSELYHHSKTFDIIKMCTPVTLSTIYYPRPSDFKHQNSNDAHVVVKLAILVQMRHIKFMLIFVFFLNFSLPN